MLCAYVLSLLAQDIHVQGLHPGERLEQLSPAAEEPATERYEWGRVVDAQTGMPVSGASVETWTEETTGPGGGFWRVGESQSGPDGGFRVRTREGAVEAEKIRVRAPGYLAFPGTVPDLELVELMPRPPWTSRVRVLDLEDRPIPDSRITTTYSCAHDVPAFEVFTGPDGVAELPEYGLQRQTPELRVRAPGYGAVKYVDHSEVPADPVHGEPALLRLARRRTFGARVLDREGRPLARRPLRVMDGEGYHVPVTDERGAFAVACSYDGHEPSIQVFDDERAEQVFSGRLPAAREVALRVGAETWPEELPVGELFLAAGETEVSLSLFHEDGWAKAEEHPGSLDFPAGEVLLLVGGAFSGWEEETRELTLPAGERLEVELAPRREPRLEILTPPETYRLVVQAGDDSIERDPVREGRTVVPVPAGREVVVLSEGAATTRRLVLPPLAADAVADLRPESCALPPTRAQLASSAPRGVVRLRARGPDGSALEVSASVVYGAGNPELAQEGPDVLRVEAPVGYPFVLGVGPEGFATCWVRGHATEDPSERVLELTPLAVLDVENETGVPLSFLGPEADEFNAVHPGPLSLVLQLADGRRAALSLVLAPGETRTLTVTSD